MTRARDIANLVDANGDVVAGALDNVPASNDASALTTGTLNGARLPNPLPAIDGSALTGIASDVVNDTTPQLGGDLSTNGNDVNFGDNDKAIFGAGNDLQIYHDGGHSRISDLGTGRLTIETNGDSVRLTKGTTENMLIATPDGAVDLYYNNSKKLATTATGVAVTGNLTATSTAKGFGRLDATGTLTLQTQSLNISSVVDNSTGNHTINVTNSYSDAEYTIPSSIGQLTNAGTHTHIGVHTYYQTASLYKLQVFHGSGAGDSEAVDSATFGALA